MADAGVDMLATHAGLTSGGDVGNPNARPLDNAIEELNEIHTAVQRRRSDVVMLWHGGPIVTPEDAATVAAATGSAGFVGASSVERIPVETAIKTTARRFKEIQLAGITGRS